MSARKPRRTRCVVARRCARPTFDAAAVARVAADVAACRALSARLEHASGTRRGFATPYAYGYHDGAAVAERQLLAMALNEVPAHSGRALVKALFPDLPPGGGARVSQRDWYTQGLLVGFATRMQHWALRGIHATG